jgi:hypothetical protein
MQRILVFLITIVTINTIKGQLPEYGMAFLQDEVAQIYITINPDTLDALLSQENWGNDREFPAQFRYESNQITETVNNIGFRLRGNTSLGAAKKSFKISFNTFVEGRKWLGLEKMNINGSHNDPSMIRAALCWNAIRRAGLPGSRVSFVKLYINNEYRGLYSNIEHIDEEFADIYISKKVNKFVDIIVGGDAQQDHISCDGKWHRNNDGNIIHSKRDNSYLIMISIDVVDKYKFSFKSDILDLSNTEEDAEVKNYLGSKGNIINYFNPDNVGNSLGNYFSKYFYALGSSISEQRDFHYDMQDEYMKDETFLPTDIKFKNDEIFSVYIQDMYNKFLNESITSSYLRMQEAEKMWFIEDNKKFIFWNISKPIIRKIFSNMFSKMKLNITGNYPTIHFRCGDVPFERHYAYHFVKYSFYKEALDTVRKKRNQEFSKVIILGCNSHRATKKCKENCIIYTQSLKAFLESIGYEVDVQCNTIIEDFAKLYYAMAVISSVSSYSFFGGLFGEGVFVSSEYNYEYNTKDTCTICDEWMIKGYQVKHQFIPDYENTSQVIQILNGVASNRN